VSAIVTVAEAALIEGAGPVVADAPDRDAVKVSSGSSTSRSSTAVTVNDRLPSAVNVRTPPARLTSGLTAAAAAAAASRPGVASVPSVAVPPADSVTDALSPPGSGLSPDSVTV
jgi:DNA-binding transcriptional LysR family regulator